MRDCLAKQKPYTVCGRKSKTLSLCNAVRNAPDSLPLFQRPHHLILSGDIT